MRSYTITATKYGFFDGAFGRRGIAGTSNQSRRISLANGQWVRDARIEMLRPAAITGIVRGESGSPLVDVTVRAYVDIFVAGAHQLAAAQSATTDDRGEYRLSGLAPGRYIVCVASVQQSAPVEMIAVQQPFTPDALSRDFAFRRDPAFAFDPIHRLISAASSPPLPAAVSGKSQAYPLTFFPGVRTIADAAVIDAAAGEEKPSIDVQLRPVPAFRVTGQLDGAADAVARMSLRLMSAGTEALGRGIEQATALVGADGSFTFLNVPAGCVHADREPRRVRVPVLSQARCFQIAAPGAGRGSMSATSVFSGTAGAMMTRSVLPGSQKLQGRQTVVVTNQDVSGLTVRSRSA